MKPQEFARYSHGFSLDGLEVMSARWVTHSFAPHMHDFYAVSLNYGGRGAFACRGELRDAAPGTCNLIAPGEFHTGYATSRQGWMYRNLYIEVPLMTTLLENLEWAGPRDVDFKSPLTEDPVLAGRLAEVFSALEAPTSLLESESLLLSVVARLAAGHFVSVQFRGVTGQLHKGVRLVRDWLDANSEQNVSIRSLSAMAGLSPYYLVRSFHRQVGVPPHKYQTLVRINQARRLLINGEAISDVAQRTGFYDQSHLNRAFTRAIGVPPGKYAASRVH